MRKVKNLLILLLCFMLAGCSSPTKQQKSIYNDERLMVSDGDSYYSKKIDDSEPNSIYFEDFTGSYTIWEKQIDESENVDVTFNCDIKKGKYKIILIKDNRMYEIIINNEEVVDREIKYSLDSGKYKIKVIGLYSSLNIKYEIK